jgi:hypothetical protein
MVIVVIVWVMNRPQGPPSVESDCAILDHSDDLFARADQSDPQLQIKNCFYLRYYGRVKIASRRRGPAPRGRRADAVQRQGRGSRPPGALLRGEAAVDDQLGVGHDGHVAVYTSDDVLDDLYADAAPAWPKTNGGRPRPAE